MKPEIVSDSAVRTAWSLNDHDGDISIEYLISGTWRVTLGMHLEAPSDSRGFTSMSVEVHPKAPADAERDISNRLLRLIPFRDAHQCAARLMLDWEAEAAPIPPASPRDPRAYAELARSFEFFAGQFPEQPLKQMAEKFDLNRNTLAARVNRAKDLGLLSRASKSDPFTLTDKARSLLDGGEE